MKNKMGQRIEKRPTQVKREIFKQSKPARKRAEGKLEEEAKLYRQIFNQSPLGIGISSLDGRVMANNGAMQTITGYTAAELSRINLLDTYEKKEDRIELLEILKQRGHVVDYPVRLKHKDGTPYDALLNISKISFGDKECFQTMCQDVSERRLTQEELKKRAEELSALQTTILDIISPHSLPELLHLIVERAAKLLHASSGGLYLADPQKHQVRCVVSYNTARDFTDTVLAYGEGSAGLVAQTGEPLIIDDYRSWSGRAKVYDHEKPFRALISVPLLWQGSVTGVIHVLRDDVAKKFTKEDLSLLMMFANHAAVAVENARLIEAACSELLVRKEAEKAARLQAEQYATVLATTMDGYWLADPQGKILDVNDVYCKMSGYTREELLKLSIPDLEALEQPQETAKHIQNIIKTGFDRFETRHKAKDGHVFDVEISVTFWSATKNMIVFIRDITASKWFEKSLRESEKYFHNLFEHAPMPYQSLDENGKLLDVNQAWLDALGYPREEVIGRYYKEFLHSNSVNLFEKNFIKFRGTGEAKDVEYEMVTRDGETILVSMDGKVSYDEQGRYQHSHYLFYDITERRQVEMDLRDSERRNRLLLEHAGVGIGYYALDGTLHMLNDIGAAHLGRRPYEVVGKPITEVFGDETGSTYLDRIRKVAEKGEIKQFEDFVNLPDGDKWFVSNYAPIKDENGKILGVQIISNDITERMQTEKNLEESEVRFHELFNNTKSCVAVYEVYKDGEDFIIQDFNKEAERIEKIRREEVIGKKVTKVFPGIKEMSLLETFRRVWKSGIPENHPVSIYKDNRITGWRENYVYKLPTGEIVTVYEDVTERKQAEQELRESEERFRHISSTISDITYSCTSRQGGEYSIDWLAGATDHIIGYSIDEIQAHGCWRYLVLEQDLPIFEKHVTGLAPGSSGNCELRLRHKNGEIVFVTSFAKCVAVAEYPECLRLFGGLVDITTRKRAEELLQKEQNLINSLMDHIPDHIYFKDLQGKFIRINNSFAQKLGLERPEQAIGKTDFDFFKKPTAQEFFQKEQATIQSGLPLQNIEEEELWIDQPSTWVSSTIMPLRNQTGDIIGTFGISRDINERKKTEQALIESENKFRWLYEYAPIAYHILTPDGVIMDVNRKWCQILGYPREEVLGKEIFDFIIAEERKAARASFIKKKMQKETFVEGSERNYLTKAGVVRTFKNYDFLVEDQSHTITSIQTTLEDITERKRAEEQIRYQAYLLANVNDAIVASDENFKITIWNAAAESLFGWKAEEAFGHSTGELLKTQYLYQTREEVLAIMAREGNWRGEITRVRKDGIRIPLEISSMTLKNEKGKILGYVNVNRDISERKQAEEETRENLLKLQKSLDGTINAIASIVEKRDPYTAGHQERVTKIAVAIAEELHLSPDQLNAIKTSGLVHDIGKISIPSEILSKPGQLTINEYQLLKVHPRDGYEILRKIDFPWPVAEIVYQHHERVNGTGYPRRLKGNAICIEAKILAVADVVEAMISHRPYRAASSIEEALHEIRINKNILYDADVVDACLKVFKKSKSINGLS